MKKNVRIICCILVCSLAIGGCQSGGSNATPPDQKIVVDKHYLFAVNTINHFLLAWLNRDYDKGVETLSDTVKSSVPQEDVRLFFTGLSNPHHQGFEIISHERVDGHTIRFQVWLYEYYSGEDPVAAERPQPHLIDVVQAGEDKWAVNGLPGQP